MKSLNGVAVAAAWSVLAMGGIAHAQEAVQWRVEDGGNGHWYRLVVQTLTWPAARTRAEELGGHLATLTTDGEALFAASHGAADAWLGAQTPANQGCDGLAWIWITGERWSHTYWAPGEPNYCSETSLAFAGHPEYSGRWNNLPTLYPHPSFFMEYSADCNGDGIVDYGQILDGTFEDANGNGVPDCCDEGVDCDPCLGDVNFDGQVNGADISVLLGFWGLNGKPNNADTNDDGQVDGADLATVLGNWGPCQ